eukprot:TRINITY_DN3304_c2_g1_i1.p1 TRINITY_DN3304_c2_g1~~TRINITY_DN3304_c2_g1_i1.p1  ORF type:complete len:258 (+),score=40.25 TRINITY_DN3304_c2_g1_i1:337-1110(+)
MTDFVFTDFPPEILALIADFVHDFDDLASLSLVCRWARNGVLLSRQWIVVEEIVAATNGNVKEQRLALHDRRWCAEYACRKGLLRCVRALDLSRSEVTHKKCRLVRDCVCAAPDAAVLSYLHTTYELTAEDLICPPRKYSVFRVAPSLEVIQYLYEVMGMTVPVQTLFKACEHGRLETLKYLHTEVGFTAEDVPPRDALMLASKSGSRDCVDYLRTAFGMTKEDARIAHAHYGPIWPTVRPLLEDVFGLGAESDESE